MPTPLGPFDDKRLALTPEDPVFGTPDTLPLASRAFTYRSDIENDTGGLLTRSHQVGFLQWGQLNTILTSRLSLQFRSDLIMWGANDVSQFFDNTQVDVADEYPEVLSLSPLDIDPTTTLPGVLANREGYQLIDLSHIGSNPGAENGRAAIAGLFYNTNDDRYYWAQVSARPSSWAYIQLPGSAELPFAAVNPPATSEGACPAETITVHYTAVAVVSREGTAAYNEVVVGGYLEARVHVDEDLPGNPGTCLETEVYRKGFILIENDLSSQQPLTGQWQDADWKLFKTINNTTTAETENVAADPFMVGKIVGTDDLVGGDSAVFCTVIGYDKAEVHRFLWSGSTTLAVSVIVSPTFTWSHPVFSPVGVLPPNRGPLDLIGDALFNRVQDSHAWVDVEGGGGGAKTSMLAFSFGTTAGPAVVYAEDPEFGSPSWVTVDAADLEAPFGIAAHFYERKLYAISATDRSLYAIDFPAAATTPVSSAAMPSLSSDYTYLCVFRVGELDLGVGYFERDGSDTELGVVVGPADFGSGFSFVSILDSEFKDTRLAAVRGHSAWLQWTGPDNGEEVFPSGNELTISIQYGHPIVEFYLDDVLEDTQLGQGADPSFTFDPAPVDGAHTAKAVAYDVGRHTGSIFNPDPASWVKIAEYTADFLVDRTDYPPEIGVQGDATLVWGGAGYKSPTGGVTPATYQDYVIPVTFGLRPHRVYGHRFIVAPLDPDMFGFPTPRIDLYTMYGGVLHRQLTKATFDAVKQAAVSQDAFRYFLAYATVGDSGNVYDVAMFATNDDTIFAAFATADLYKSTDGGATWSYEDWAFDTNFPLPAGWIRHDTNDDRVYASNRFFITQDLGAEEHFGTLIRDEATWQTLYIYEDELEEDVPMDPDRRYFYVAYGIQNPNDDPTPYLDWFETTAEDDGLISGSVFTFTNRHHLMISFGNKRYYNFSVQRTGLGGFVTEVAWRWDGDGAAVGGSGSISSPLGGTIETSLHQTIWPIWLGSSYEVLAVQEVTNDFQGDFNFFLMSFGGTLLHDFGAFTKRYFGPDTAELRFAPTYSEITGALILVAYAKGIPFGGGGSEDILTITLESVDGGTTFSITTVDVTGLSNGVKLPMFACTWFPNPGHQFGSQRALIPDMDWIADPRY